MAETFHYLLRLDSSVLDRGRDARQLTISAQVAHGDESKSSAKSSNSPKSACADFLLTQVKIGQDRRGRSAKDSINSENLHFAARTTRISQQRNRTQRVTACSRPPAPATESTDSARMGALTNGCWTRTVQGTAAAGLQIAFSVAGWLGLPRTDPPARARSFSSGRSSCGKPVDGPA
jgi:hypothetical protein